MLIIRMVRVDTRISAAQEDRAVIVLRPLHAMERGHVYSWRVRNAFAPTLNRSDIVLHVLAHTSHIQSVPMTRRNQTTLFHKSIIGQVLGWVYSVQELCGPTLYNSVIPLLWYVIVHLSYRCQSHALAALQHAPRTNHRCHLWFYAWLSLDRIHVAIVT